MSGVGIVGKAASWCFLAPARKLHGVWLLLMMAKVLSRPSHMCKRIKVTETSRECQRVSSKAPIMDPQPQGTVFHMGLAVPYHKRVADISYGAIGTLLDGGTLGVKSGTESF
jgi:hypothetical protein